VYLAMAWMGMRLGQITADEARRFAAGLALYTFMVLLLVTIGFAIMSSAETKIEIQNPKEIVLPPMAVSEL